MRRSFALVVLAATIAACSAAPAAPSANRSPAAEAGDSPTITPSATPTTEPDPSPSATAGLSGQVAYSAGDDPQVFLLDLATGDSRQLTELTDEHARVTGHGQLAPALTCGFGIQALSWSPSGSQLAFAYGACDAVVYVVDLDGNLRRIGNGRSPAWSPDGRRLVFSPNIPYCPMPDCGDPPLPGAWNLQVVDVDAETAPRPLTMDETTAQAGQPTYSADGALIAFAAPLPDPAKHPELFAATYVVDADGTNPRLVAHGAWPSGWLPDGRLALVDERSGDMRALDVATADAVPLGGDAGPASISPDGSRMLLTRFDPQTGAPDVRLATLEGEQLADVVDGSPAAWAPDSRAAVIIELGQEPLLTIIDRDGAELGSFPLPPSLNSFPIAAWRPGT